MANKMNKTKKFYWKQSVKTALLIDSLQKGWITGDCETREYILDLFKAIHGPIKNRPIRPAVLRDEKPIRRIKDRIIAIRRSDGKYVLSPLRSRVKAA
jgi:hypothetical protein